MKKIVIFAALLAGLAWLAGAAACGHARAANRGGSAPAQMGLAKMEEVNAFLDEHGAPDQSSIPKMYEWLVRLFPYDNNDTTYEFSPEELHQVAQLGVGLPVGEAWEAIHAELMRLHPGKILETPRWTFNSAGNAVCQIAIVYASTKEYVAFFGTPIGAAGFSGRYQSDVWDLMVDGEMWTYVPGQFEKTVYKAGDLAYLPQGGGKGVQYVDHAWMIDYGRGNVISMFPFGIIAPTLFTTLDYQSAWQEFIDFARAAIQALLNQ